MDKPDLSWLAVGEQYEGDNGPDRFDITHALGSAWFPGDPVNPQKVVLNISGRDLHVIIEEAKRLNPLATEFLVSGWVPKDPEAGQRVPREDDIRVKFVVKAMSELREVKLVRQK